MIANTFVHRVALKAACALLLPVALLAALAGAARPPATPAATAALPELPVQWDGAPLRPQALGAVEARFARQFPGRIARFAVEGAAPGALVLRTVHQPTRALHPATDCYRGLGWRIGAQQLERDARARLWRCFEATHGGQRLRVCERIEDAQGQGFTDTSAWYWAALTGRSHGPWQAVTVARPL